MRTAPRPVRPAKERTGRGGARKGSLGADHDLLGARLFGDRQRDIQDAVLVRRADPCGLDLFRKGDGSMEPAFESFRPIAGRLFAAVLEPAFAGHREDPVMQGDVEVLLLHPWDFEFDHQVLLVFVHIERWRPDIEELSSERRGRSSEQAVEFLLQLRERVEGWPMGEGSGSSGFVAPLNMLVRL